MSLLEIEDLKVKIEKRCLVDIKRFSFEKGFIYTIFGKSGAGKSTFLKALGSMIKYEGNIYLNGENLKQKYPLTEIRKKVHYIRQVPEFVPGKVIDSLKYIFSFKSNRDLGFDENYLNVLIDKFGLDRSILGKDIKNLSGGEKQRISIRRSLLIRPEFILLDEPTSALDVYTEDNFITFLNGIKNEFGVIVVSHSVDMIISSDIKLFFDKCNINRIEEDIDTENIRKLIGE
jgi:putative ABC transport system ATP-binding protein